MSIIYIYIYLCLYIYICLYIYMSIYTHIYPAYVTYEPAGDNCRQTSRGVAQPTVLSTNSMMRWRTTTQHPVPLQYHHHERPKGGTVQQASPSETCADRICAVRFPTLCRNRIRRTELCCSDALGSDAVEWLWSGALKWLQT